MSIARVGLVTAFCALLGSCQTSKDPGLELVWVRVDGQRIASSPELQQKFEIDLTVCKGETQKAAVGMAPIYYRGIVGALEASAIENQRSSALTDVAKGCMAQRGYLRMTRNEALARENAGPAPTAPKSARRRTTTAPKADKKITAISDEGGKVSDEGGNMSPSAVPR